MSQMMRLITPLVFTLVTAVSSVSNPLYYHISETSGGYFNFFITISDSASIIPFSNTGSIIEHYTMTTPNPSTPGAAEAQTPIGSYDWSSVVSGTYLTPTAGSVVDPGYPSILVAFGVNIYYFNLYDSTQIGTDSLQETR